MYGVPSDEDEPIEDIYEATPDEVADRVRELLEAGYLFVNAQKVE